MRFPIPMLLPVLLALALPACKTEGYYETAGLVGQDRSVLAHKRIEGTRDDLAAVRGAFDDAPVLLKNLADAKDAEWKTAAARAAKTGPRCEKALSALNGSVNELESVVASLANAWVRDGGSPLDPKAKDLVQARADKLRAAGLSAVTDLRKIGSELRPGVVDMQEVARFVDNHQTAGGADDVRPMARKAAKGCADAADLVTDAQKSLTALEKEIMAGPTAK